MKKLKKDWLYRFHDCEPDFLIPLSELSTITQKNLKWFVEHLGIQFNIHAKAWPVENEVEKLTLYSKDLLQESDQLVTTTQTIVINHELNTKEITSEKYTVKRRRNARKDILVSGMLMNCPIEYWRHETASRAAGQTLIYFNGCRHQANYIKHCWPKDIKLNGVLREDTLTILLAHDSDMVRDLAKSLLSLSDLK